MRTFLLLGGNGFLGVNLCRRLVDSNRVIIYSNSSGLPEDLLGKAEWIGGNFRDEREFEKMLEGVDVVVHLISTIIPSDFTDDIEREIDDNIAPTIRLLEAARSRPGLLLVYFSSGGAVYGNCPIIPAPETAALNPISPYGVQKAAIEMYVRMYSHIYGMKYKILRLSNPYGVSQDPDKKQGVIPIFTRSVLCGKEIRIWGDGSNIRDYIYIEDAMDGVEAALSDNSGASVYNIGSGKGYSLNQVLELIRAESGANHINVNYLPKRACDVGVNVLDISMISESTGWSPKVSLEQGIRDIVRQQKLQGWV